MEVAINLSLPIKLSRVVELFIGEDVVNSFDLKLKVKINN